MRKGFTLVEIMVVVVILGVLAGVGVPKLFGVIAKARASEVPRCCGYLRELAERLPARKQRHW